MKINLSDVEIQVSRSSGSGGQNVNKVNTKVTLLFNLDKNLILTQDQQDRFKQKFKNRINKEGILVLQVDQFRTQKLNIDQALKILQQMIDSILIAPKKRLKTKPTKSSKIERVKVKRKRSEIKKMRSQKNFD